VFEAPRERPSTHFGIESSAKLAGGCGMLTKAGESIFAARNSNDLPRFAIPDEPNTRVGRAALKDCGKHSKPIFYTQLAT
jgi:hypothetical protein